MQPYKARVIRDLIGKSRRIFKIPVYQRNYDWKNTQCKKLFEDILKAYDKDKDHFMGTMVYLKITDSSQLEEVLIIDGQQRITSVYILLKALYDYAKKEENYKLEDIIKDYLFNKKCEENQKLKLKPIKSDNEQLNYLMKNELEELSKESNIYQNYILFDNLIEEALSKNYTIEDILEGIEKLEVVEIVLDNSQGDEAQIIFESINSTGLELSVADLIRNYLLMDDKKQEFLFEEYWLKIEKMIGYDNLEEFFLHFLNSKLSDVISLKNIYQKFKIYYEKNFKNHEEILLLLKKYAYYYSAFIGKNEKYSVEINECLNSFSMINQTTIYPFLLLLFDDFESKKINEKEMIKILKFLLSYTVRRIICEIPSNSLRGIYKSLYNRTIKSNQKDYYYKIVRFFEKIKTRDKIISDKEFKQALIYKPLYKKPICKFILSTIENSTKEKIDILNLTIEHILPQKENSVVWKEEIGKNYKEVYELYLHTLGNLTITGLNSELGTKPFLEKKKIISENSKANILNNLILKSNTWNEETIVKRAEFLANKILKIFEYDKVEIELNNNEEEIYNLDSEINVTNTKPQSFTFRGEKINVKSYSEMLEKFLELVYDLDSKILTKLAKNDFSLPQARNTYITYNKEKLRKARELSKTGIFFETNLNSVLIIYFIKQIIQDETEFETSEFEFILK
ncbi:DUF262 domain-containing HNH endonuclease family protein [Fusobacterium polymorphum]|uniref:DUF262 domain-containing protein n=1 Tax=Fusobacterium nucleatum subsp. polymorphum TaxID=76857 RepID=UPI0020C18BBC|nr:DUF262 domain-containing protein [Fusobacterium polymorphum]UTI52411.1 DUF262 domain-containing HNH endonuclease family protein [Fusobacterium polymorphum]